MADCKEIKDQNKKSEEKKMSIENQNTARQTQQYIQQKCSGSRVSMCVYDSTIWTIFAIVKNANEFQIDSLVVRMMNTVRVT